jgi:hypothetical protein
MAPRSGAIACIWLLETLVRTKALFVLSNSSSETGCMVLGLFPILTCENDRWMVHTNTTTRSNLKFVVIWLGLNILKDKIMAVIQAFTEFVV